MSRTLGCILLFLAFTSVVYARKNICLANTATGTPYKPLQLQPSDCPNNASNCMAYVYKYSATAFMSQGPSQILPVGKNRESLVYMTQDASDNLDVVVITATSYNDNTIPVNVKVTGAAPGAQTLVRDDPTPDLWNWNPANNSGSFTWYLDSGFTDGVVLGHFQLINNYCFQVQFLPNYNGAIAQIVFLSGTVAAPTRVITSKFITSWFQFCQYPQATVTGTDATCTTPGSATATSQTSGTASYLWTNSANATVATTQTVTGLAAGNYTVAITVNGCTAYRPVTIGLSGTPISATNVVTNPTRTTAGSIDLTISGGNPPYSITWQKAGSVVANNVTTLSVSAANAGTYTVIITDGCYTKSYDIAVSAPGTCPAGTMIDANGVDCDACPPGTFSATPESSSCTVCPPGQWNNVTNATSCHSCSANQVSVGGTGPCTDCGVSTFSSAGSGTCTPCAVGTERAAGASSCTPCAAGSYRCADSSTCQSCAAGTFSSTGQQVCTPCDPGTFAASTGSTSCLACGANTYAASGASSCTACPPGTFTQPAMMAYRDIAHPMPAALIGATVIQACM